MPIIILIVVLVVAFIVYIYYNSSNTKKQSAEAMKREAETKKRREEIIERRKQYVEAIAPSTRIIVNNGVHLFFKDDELRFFGVDESGQKYSFEDLQRVGKYDNYISLGLKNSKDLVIGKDFLHPDTTVALGSKSINAISEEMMPVLRENLKRFLDENAVHPTHEYEHENCIYGCDINSEQFYMAYGCLQVYDFATLKKVTIEDESNNRYCTANYVIHIYLRHYYDSSMDQYPVCDIYFDSKDSTFYNILSMYKGILNRQ